MSDPGYLLLVGFAGYGAIRLVIDGIIGACWSARYARQLIAEWRRA